MNNAHLTIFTTFKPFFGHTKIIQINAIKSWLLLAPKPEIIVFGNAPGSQEISKAFNLRHFPDNICTPSGAPYANVMFDMVETLSNNSILAYLNGDIILNNSFMFAIQKTYNQFSKFLIVGCRWDTNITEYIDYKNPDWQNFLQNIVNHHGTLHGPRGIDYFVYTKGLWPIMPPLIVGRAYWDNALMALSTSLDIPVIDATEQVLAVHQNHDYSHMIGGKDEVWNGKEAIHNLRIVGDYNKLRNISHASWIFTQQGLKKKEKLKRNIAKLDNRINLLQVNTFYPEYIKHHYAKYPDLQYQSYLTQIQSLLNDGFSSGNILTPYLSKEIFSSDFVIANNPYTQARWIQEHQLNITYCSEWFYESVRKQIEIIQPDILYIADPIRFDHSFIQQLEWKPKLIIGWRASFFKPTTDLRDYDILFSHLSYCLNKSVLAGAKASAYMLPGFSSSILELIKQESKKWDFIFTGHAMQIHQKRNKFLIDLAKVYTKRHDIVSAYFIGSDTNVLPPDLPILTARPRWGIEMYQEIQRARIVLNADIDIADEAGNFRLFEVTGIGSFLLTEYHPNIDQLFKPGVEIETFRDSNELIAKVRYYLDHPNERERIARRGQERCFRDHLIENRVKRFERFVFKYFPK